MFMKRFLIVLVFGGCTLEEPCQDYIDYMCDCHAAAGDTGQSCEDYTATYSGADADLQDECVLALETQQTLDDASGEGC